MNVQPLKVTQEQASAALLQYKAHRNAYDRRDWEIERIFRQISKGKIVISLRDAIVRGGIDDIGRPRLAVMRADQWACRCVAWRSESVVFTNEHDSRAADWHFDIPWPNRTRKSNDELVAILPRIPPQFRPAGNDLSGYHLLWEAEWNTLPHDPVLLKRIGKDAFVVVAAWDLTEVEMSVLRAHQ